MSISGALSNALSGLTAASRASQVVSDNVANVQTEGFGRRELSLSARSLAGSGAGVRIDGVRRIVDEGLLRDRRVADAGLGYAGDRAAAMKAVAELLGTPDQARSLAGRLRAFDGALTEAASRPDSNIRLDGVVRTANALAGELNNISKGIQKQRQQAETSIAAQVGKLNNGLRQVAELNSRIASMNGPGRDVSALEDQRQKLIDDLARIVEIKQVPRDDGRIALFTSGGAVLVDGPAAAFEFSSVGTITPDMSLAGGALSLVTSRGRPMPTTGAFAPLGGGTLAAAFEIRDTLLPEAQSRLDSFARDLIERFSDPAVDPTRAAAQPALFTDSGAGFSVVNEVGIAGRITLNSLVDPGRGGEVWRLRDGLGAATAGPVGNAALLTRMSDALAGGRVPGSDAITRASRTSFTLVSDLTSLASSASEAGAREAGFATARQGALRDLELQNGVNTDQELQKLLLIERNYAANARVIRTIDSLIANLLEI